MAYTVLVLVLRGPGSPVATHPTRIHVRANNAEKVRAARNRCKRVLGNFLVFTSDGCSRQIIGAFRQNFREA